MSASSDRVSKPRVAALVGPQGSGKTTLFEALLTAAGASIRRTETRDRSMGTELRIGQCTFMDDPWTIIDCPGSVEFAAETAGALAIADLAVVVCEPMTDRTLTLAPLLRMLEADGIPHILFINKVESLSTPVRDVLAALQAHSARPLVLRQVPIRETETVSGYVDVVSERAYRYRKGEASELISLPAPMQAREQEALAGLVEVLADHDDALLEKVVEDIKPTSEEIYRQLHKDQAAGAIVGVLLGAADRDHGMRRLWKALRHDTPGPEETASRHGIAAEGGKLAQIFKTTQAGHAGKLSYARIWRGPIQDGETIGGVRVGGIYRLPAGEPVKAQEAATGDVAALARLEGIATGGVLGGPETPSFPAPPAPVYTLAIATQNRKDDVRLSGALQKLLEEDPSLTLTHDAESSETILHGQGEIHLNAAIDKLGRVYNVPVTSHRPRVAFRETIRHPVHQHSRLKRQTGGHGQFADVKLDIAPRARGEGFEFHDRIVGGAVPRQYIPAVGEAAEEATKKGPLGYPVVDVSVTLVDGTFHSVDSSDMAFRTATRMGMTEGLARAEPILLEPFDRVTVSVPADFTAATQRLLSGRRGQILGYAAKDGWSGWDEVVALVPEAELHDLIIELRSQTLGLGTFQREFDHLAEAHARIAERAVKEAASAAAAR